MFKLGILGLEERAVVESLFWKLARGMVALNRGKKRLPRETHDLGDKIADQYMANFSLFQSAPDHWAFDQLFPIVPLHRLDEAPTRDCTIVDITCDSDGKIDRFIEGDGVDETLSLHPLEPGEPYYLGMFLTGAYQDIMGDMHNLFGRVNEIHVFVDDDDPEDFYIEEIIRGDHVAKVLLPPLRARRPVPPGQERARPAIKDGSIRPKEGVSLSALLRGSDERLHLPARDAGGGGADECPGSCGAPCAACHPAAGPG